MRRILGGLLAVTVVGAAACSDTTGPTTGPPANLMRVAGHDQQGVVGTALADELVIRVTDADGTPVAGADVTWTVTTGGGSMNPAAGATDADGEARSTWTLGTGTGSQSVTATVTDLPPVTFSAEACASLTSELSGSMSVDYEGDDTGSFSSSGTFRLCPGGNIASDDWAVSFFDTQDGLHHLIASSRRENGGADLVWIFLDGEVTTTGAVTWDFNACEAGDEAMCGADGLLALDFPVDATIDEAAFLYFFDTGTIDFTSLTSNRVGGILEGEGFTYDGSDRALSASDGAFDLPLVDDAEVYGSPAVGAAIQMMGLDNDLGEIARRLADRRRER